MFLSLVSIREVLDGCCSVVRRCCEVVMFDKSTLAMSYVKVQKTSGEVGGAFSFTRFTASTTFAPVLQLKGSGPIGWLEAILQGEGIVQLGLLIRWDSWIHVVSVKNQAFCWKSVAKVKPIPSKTVMCCGGSGLRYSILKVDADAVVIPVQSHLLYIQERLHLLVQCTYAVHSST